MNCSMLSLWRMRWLERDWMSSWVIFIGGMTLRCRGDGNCDCDCGGSGGGNVATSCSADFEMLRRRIECVRRSRRIECVCRHSRSGGGGGNGGGRGRRDLDATAHKGVDGGRIELLFGSN
jgi:hypothetical protein